jgi:hypothetical protein
MLCSWNGGSLYSCSKEHAEYYCSVRCQNEEGDYIIQVGDCVELQIDQVKTRIAHVLALWEAEDGSKWAEVRYFFRIPELSAERMNNCKLYHLSLVVDF